MQLNKFILYSLAVHFLIVGFFLLLSKTNSESKNDQPIEISFLDENEKMKPDQLQMIVDSDSNVANYKLSEKAKYLSEKTNTVEKETRAKSGEKFQNAHKPQQAQARVTPAKPQIFTKSFDAYGSMTKNSEAKAKKAVTGSTAESTTNDNLKNVESDLITRLNTKEYKYYGYYNRIKNQLNQWWVPKVQQKFTNMLRQGRTIASEENKITKLVIVLNDAGNLVRVQVLAASGVRDLDDAAIEAFRSAAPFPNPPKGMIDSDGTVKIRWDCVVES